MAIFSECAHIQFLCKLQQWATLLQKEIPQSSKSAFTRLKLTIETLEQGVKWRRVGFFIVNVEHISHFGRVFRLLN